MAACDAVAEGKRDGEDFRPGGLDVLAQHVMACACAGPFDEVSLLAEVRSSASYAGIDDAEWRRVLDFVSTGGYALRAYDRFRRIVRDRGGLWRLAHPEHAARHRLNAGIIIDSEMMEVRFRNGRALGKVEEDFGAQLAPGDTFRFAGLDLEVEGLRDNAILVRAARKSGMIPSYMGARMPLTTHLADRVRAMLTDRAGWGRLPDDVREWLEMQDWRSRLPGPDELLVESFPHGGRAYTVYYTFEGWNANQSLGMLITRRMEEAVSARWASSPTTMPLPWGLRAVPDPATMLSPEILADEFVDWARTPTAAARIPGSRGDFGPRRTTDPGKRKSGRQVTFSTDLIYDVLSKYEPDHLLLQAAWADAGHG
jgi:ATP-dependent Lhr-like helicase